MRAPKVLLVAGVAASLAACAQLAPLPPGPTQAEVEAVRDQIVSLQSQVQRLETERKRGEQAAREAQSRQRELAALQEQVQKLQKQLEAQQKAAARTGIGLRDVGVAPAALQAAPFYENSWAVIIGIDDYAKAARLQYAVNDAQSVAEALPAFGFPRENIFLLLNEKATKRTIQSALGDTLPQKAKANDRVFVFFAGHGVTRELPGGGGALGYLVPYDGDLAQLHATGISMRDLGDISRLIPAKHMFIAVDACYSGLILERAIPAIQPDVKGYLELVTKRPVRQILVAGLKDQQVIEEAGHGIFTRKFLEGLRGAADLNGDGAITGFEMGSWVAPQVASATQNRQTPQFGTMAGDGQFIFLTPAAMDPLAGATARIQQLHREIELERRRAQMATETARRLAQASEERIRAERERLHQERESLQALLGKVEEERRALEEVREVTEKREKVRLARVPRGIRIHPRIRVADLADGALYYVVHSDFTIQFTVARTALGHALEISGTVIERNLSKPIIARICWLARCGSSSDGSAVIAQPGASPIPGEHFRVSLRGAYRLSSMQTVEYLSEL